MCPSIAAGEPVDGGIPADELSDSRAQLAFALSQKDALLRTLDLHSKVSVTDCSGLIIEVNDNFCRTSGYSREELLGHPHSIVNSGTQSAQFWRDMWRTIAGGEPWRGEICNRAKNGSLYWVDSIITPMMGPDGRAEKYVSIRTDITAAKMAEHRIRASEEFLERTGRIAGIGGWQFDLDTRCIAWSTQMQRIHDADLGYQPTLEQALSFYTAESRPIVERAVFEAMSVGTGWDLELQLLTRAGRPIWVRSVGTVELVAGKPVRLLGSLQDISAGKRTEKSLSYERDLMASLLESLPDQIYFKDCDGKFLRVNTAMARCHGLKSPAEAIGKTEADYFPKAYAQRSAELERGIVASGEPVLDSEQQVIWADRQPSWSLSTKMPLYDGDDRIVGTFGISRDITARKLIAAQLQDTNTRLGIAADCADIGVWEFDPASKTFNWDDWMYRIYGMPRSSGPEPFANWALSLHPEDRQRCEAEFATALRGGKGFDSEFRIVRPNGEIRYVKAASRARRSAQRLIDRITGVVFDVTELTDATHKAEHANRAKSQFLANMSHEIRTPMNAVIGLSYLLSHTALQKEQSELLSKIQSSSDSLLAVINDVLDLTKIEAGELIVDSTPFSPAALLRGLSGVMERVARAKGITLEMKVTEDLPMALRGDSTRLNQILTNLLANAVKFTDRGTVELIVSRLADSASGASLCFVVRDTGIGIAEEAQSRLFAPFAQADASITRRFGGTGLGLSIVKSLTNLLGGDVRLSSTPGVGSEFTVVLPFALADAAIAAPLQTPANEQTLCAVSVLVVDDSDINLEVTKRILELHGAVVCLASNGREAIEILRARPQGFDLVLMDVQMPILDGYQAARQIRGDLGLLALPIIALTAGALSSERQCAMAAGMDDFIVKPIDARTLASRILRHVRAKHTQPAARQDWTPAPVAATLAWPVIEGIDSTDTALRLCGDFALFQMSLKRLIEEFPGDEMPEISGDLAALTLHAARMHKLVGCAATLGARAVQKLAGEVRSACVAADFEQAKRLSGLLAQQLKRLSHSAAPVQETARIDAASADQAAQASLPPEAKLDPRQLHDLIEMTRDRSLAALQRFAAVAPQLRRHLGKDIFETLRNQMENLRFTEAAAGLTAAQSSLAVSEGWPSRVSRTLSSKVEIGNGFSSSTVSGPMIP
jgi:PAS domain S-box-containing protein